ncbi:MAG TPA: DsrE family protein [Usitatibacter sp.]|nr:DsrE family protein [Usitatibacter sp.]
MQSIVRRMAAAAALAFAASGVAMAGDPPIRVVYHINEGVQKAPAVLRNIANELDAEPNTKIVVVAHGMGIDFLLKDAKDPKGNAFTPEIETLGMRGVEFRVCNNTLESRHIDKSRVVPDAKIVPSGVAEIAKLESQGYVYLKP